MASTPLSIVILISGNGSNLQAIINAVHSKLLKVDIKAVISNNETAYGLKRASNANIASHVLQPKNYATRHDYDAALSDCISKLNPDLIILAGFMRILGDTFLQAFKNKIINIHPSLLPKYPGLNTHELVIAEGEFEHGCSIHYVNEDLDGGPIIAQAAIKILSDDTCESLKERVHKCEHFLYPVVINWFSKNRLQLKKSQVLLDEIPIPAHGLRFGLNI